MINSTNIVLKSLPYSPVTDMHFYHKKIVTRLIYYHRFLFDFVRRFEGKCPPFELYHLLKDVLVLYFKFNHSIETILNPLLILMFYNTILSDLYSYLITSLI